MDHSLSEDDYKRFVAYMRENDMFDDCPDDIYNMSSGDLVAEALDLPNPWRSLLSHNEQQLVDFCVRLAAKLKCLQNSADYAESCADDHRFD